MENLKFYDVRLRKSFMSDKYEIKLNKRGTRYAQTIAPSGAKAFRILGNRKVD